MGHETPASLCSIIVNVIVIDSEKSVFVTLYLNASGSANFSGVTRIQITIYHIGRFVVEVKVAFK